MSNIIILGGDGYLGWPTAMYFSNQGHNVTVADNYSKRSLELKTSVSPLYQVPDLIERAKAWYDLTGNEIKVLICDLAEPKQMASLFKSDIDYSWSVNKRFSGIPDTVIHFAEQPSAPYSLLDNNAADYTLVNNLRTTNNLLFSIRSEAPDCHIIKLGTMGEYGTPNIDIEEGWLDVEHKGRKQKFLYPRQASSIYHTSKIMDTDLIWFAVRTWGLKVTDLMQGPVYGIETSESKINDKLALNFYYDEFFGTVINRFIVQSVVGHPLTVYGSGHQVRGYINILDTIKCIEVAHQNPAKQKELRIFNQITETFSVIQLAEKIQKVAAEIGLDVAIKHIENPRVESEKHYYNPKYQGLKDLGFEPNFLTNEILEKMMITALNYQNNIRNDIIFNGIKW